eukprot:11119313-Karenia_brevis.AAC.1
MDSDADPGQADQLQKPARAGSSKRDGEEIATGQTVQEGVQDRRELPKGSNIGSIERRDGRDAVGS